MKRFFLSRSGREQGLLLAFAALLAVTWLLGAIGRARVAGENWRLIRAEKTTQQLWLDREAAIMARAAEAVQQLDPAKTLNGARLVAELNAMANAAGLSAEVSGLRTETAGRFAFHAVQVSFRRVELGALVRFYTELVQRSPYLGAEQLSLQVDRGTPGQLNVTLRVVAAELAP
jgi:hypothetical protein